ncbi:putative reticulon-like protein B17/18/21 [Dioscorea sansibarensis]
MQGNSRRRSITKNAGVASGSVWETRMKMDQVKGGIKVFNGDNGNDNRDEEGMRVYRRLVRNQSDPSSMGSRKRRSWRQPEIHENGGCNAIQLKKSVSELSKREDSVSVEEEEEEEEKEVEIDKEMDLVVVVDEPKSEAEEKVDQIFETPAPTPTPAPEKIEHETIDLRAMHPDPVKPPSPVSNAKINEQFEAEEEEVVYQCETKLGDHNRMQTIVDLVMWRDISKSAFVFGFGSFFLLSSSYAKDLEFSLISAISYLGLVYLALVFVYKSILQRGAGMEYFDEMVIGEEEATWILRFLLPYINEILLNIKALFSGDPATTMKLAVVLFVMARCGSSITIWTLSKLLFFGVFTIPKLYSSSSFQLARYGKFWFERVKDGWESCTHKKAVAMAIFTVLWNLSSTIARIWGIFMLLVAMKFYQQQCMVAQEWHVEEVEEEVVQEEGEDSKAVNGPLMGPSLGSSPKGHRHKSGPIGERKLKKWN